MERRVFLKYVVGGAAGLLLHPSFLPAAGFPNRYTPEYAGSLDEFLFVYDQSAAPHLMREIVEILRHAPADARIHVLVSRSLANGALEHLASFGLQNVKLLISDEQNVSGDWGRDIFQLGFCADGQRCLGVPWFKAAARREELDRGWRRPNSG